MESGRGSMWRVGEGMCGGSSFCAWSVGEGVWHSSSLWLSVWEDG